MTIQARLGHPVSSARDPAAPGAPEEPGDRRRTVAAARGRVAKTALRTAKRIRDLEEDRVEREQPRPEGEDATQAHGPRTARLSVGRRVLIGAGATLGGLTGALGIAQAPALLGADAPPRGPGAEVVVDQPAKPDAPITLDQARPPEPTPSTAPPTSEAPAPSPPVTEAPAPKPATPAEQLQAIIAELPYSNTVKWEIVPYARFGHEGVYCPPDWAGQPPCEHHTIYIADIVFNKGEPHLRSVLAHELAHALTMPAYVAGDPAVVQGWQSFAAKYTGGDVNLATEIIADSVCSGWGQCSWRHYAQPTPQMMSDALALVRPPA